MDEPSRSDLQLVEEIARMQVLARRAACSIRLDHPSRELRELLELAGLTEVVPTTSA